MKQCPYCGKEYSDDAVVCAIDGKVLKDDAPKPEQPRLWYPDYRWTAKDAWKCLGTIILLQFVLETMDYLLELNFAALRGCLANGAGYSVRSFFYAVPSLLATAYFARTVTRVTFLKGFGLSVRPTKYAWWGIIGALALRFFELFALSHGWSNEAKNSSLDAFESASGLGRYFYLVPSLVVAPFFEESVNRGFLYKAFRGSYPVAISILLMVAWACFVHRNQFIESWAAAVELTLLTVLQCYLREKSPSLWDCILCHFVFNLSVFFV